MLSRIHIHRLVLHYHFIFQFTNVTTPLFRPVFWRPNGCLYIRVFYLTGLTVSEVWPRLDTGVLRNPHFRVVLSEWLFPRNMSKRAFRSSIENILGISKCWSQKSRERYLTVHLMPQQKKTTLYFQSSSTLHYFLWGTNKLSQILLLETFELSVPHIPIFKLNCYSKHF